MNRIFHLIFKGLQCYKHDYCLNKCPELSESIVECKKEETHCWKMTSPLGTLRGCALQCYSHDTCSMNCPKLSNTIRSCTSEDNGCYTSAFHSGIVRGCSKERCNVQVSSLVFLLKSNKYNR
ncbi:unnamed protein product [Rotaria sp. Silwood1]|nr:unnamed protein product [Rotaria sp. Silwood1]